MPRQPLSQRFQQVLQSFEQRRAKVGDVGRDKISRLPCQHFVPVTLSNSGSPMALGPVTTKLIKRTKLLLAKLLLHNNKIIKL